MPERLVAPPEPRLDLACRLRVEIDDGAALVVGRFATVDEVVLLQVPRKPARSRQRQPEGGGELADGVGAFGSDVREERYVARAETRSAVQERSQLVGGTAPAPERSQHLT
jgi:hypothetical protein